MNYSNLGDHTGLEKVADMCILNCKHTFSADELEQESQLLAQAVTDKAAEEANKKAAIGVFKNKIDTLDAEVKLRAGHVTHGFTWRDKPTDMYLDFDNAKRVYFDKGTGDFIKEETFHASDYQKKLDFEAQQEQIDENNEVGDMANGADPLDKVIKEKVKRGKKSLTIVPDTVEDENGLPE